MLYVLAGYFVVLVGLSLVRVVPVKSAAVQRLRAFFPSWKFFDDVGVVQVLMVRVGRDENDLGEWTHCLHRVRRRWYAPVVNPEATLHLAYGSLLQQLVAEVEEMPVPYDVESAVSYQLTHHLVRATLTARPGLWYQFKVCVVEPGRDVGLDDDLIISPVYAA
jgi:hypothetical protein